MKEILSLKQVKPFTAAVCGHGFLRTSPGCQQIGFFLTGRFGSVS